MSQNIQNSNTIYEDTLQCLIFSTNKSSSNNNWIQKCSEINDFIDTLSNGYLWHKDKFKVCKPLVEQPDLPEHLLGITCFGDNIEDEWFIVHLVLEITRRFKEFIIQVTDCDGDFLLIEAADNLPQWANPQSTDNRVFIYNGKIHIIPPALMDVDSDLSVQDAINIIFDNYELTLASPEIQQNILKRIGNYPDKIKEDIHEAIVNLPLDIATLLKVKPSIISTLVTTYCNHDPIDAKHCRDLKYDNFIPTKVKFTKCLYAMLISSKMINLRLSYMKTNDKKSSLGIKLTCGFQMMMKQNSSDIYSTKQFYRFTDSLKSNGYFKNNLEGSRDYNTLLNNAKDYFKNMECSYNASACDDIQELMSSKEFSEVRETLKNQDASEDLSEDNDAWLNIDPNELTEILESRYGRPMKDKIKPETMSSQLTSFLQQTSDFEGIEPAERDHSKEDNQIEFDSDEFIGSLQKMLTMVSNNEELDSDICSDTDDDVMDNEIREKLSSNDNFTDEASIFRNLIQSVKEEGRTTGPTSNLLKNIGITKKDMLDSDDDE